MPPRTIARAAATMLAWLGLSLAAPATPVGQNGDTAALQVTVRVTDSGGRSVHGLTPADLTVTVGGQPARIRSLREVTFAARTAGPDDSNAAPPSDVVSTHLPSGGRRLIAIAVDEDGVAPEPEFIARLRTVLEELVAAAGPDDDVAFVSDLRSPMARNTGFDHDPARLSAALDRTVERQRSPRTAIDGNAVPERNRLAHETLQAVIRSMAGAQHDDRMVIVVGATMGPPASATTVATRTATIDLARDYGVALNVVDLRQPRSTPARVTLGREREAMAEAIASTGGLLVAPGTEPRDAARRMFQAHEACYVADIETRATTGARIVVDAGAVAEVIVAPSIVTSPPGPQEDAVSTTLHGAVRFGVPRDELTMHAAVAPVGRVGKSGVRTAITVDARPAERDAPLGPAVEVHLMAFGADDTVVRLLAVPTTSGEQHLLWQGEVDLPAETTRVGVGVQSRTSSAIGTLSVPVAMPDFSLPLSMSAIVVGSPGAADPAGRSALPFAPILTRGFTRREAPTVFARVFWQSNLVGSVRLTTSLRTATGDVVASRVAALDTPPDAVGDLRDAEVQFPLPVSQLGPGTYEVSLEAAGRDAGGTVRRSLRFVIR